MMKRLLFLIGTLVSIIGCSPDIRLSTVYFSHLYNDVQREYELPYKVDGAVISIETTCDFDKKNYLKMMDVANNGNVGILCPPDLTDCVLTVSTSQNVKVLEMTVEDGEMKSLIVWDSDGPVYEAEGAFKSDCMYDQTIYSFVSGAQSVYKNGKCLYHLISDYKIGCDSFTREETTYIDEEYKSEKGETKKGYYEETKKCYKTSDNYYDPEWDDTNYSEELLSRNLLNKDKLHLSSIENMSIKHSEVKFYRSNIRESGGIWHMAIFPSKEGVFFLLDSDLNPIGRGPAFDFYFTDDKHNDKIIRFRHLYEDGWKKAKNETLTLNMLCGFYQMSVSEKYEFSFDRYSGYDVDEMSYNVILSEIDIEVSEYLQEYLQNFIKEESDQALKEFRAINRHLFAKDSKTYRDICGYCSGLGKVPQTFNGAVVGMLNCPACGGSGYHTRVEYEY